MLSPNALTTIERARDAVGVTEEQDGNVIEAINLASDIIERFCNRKFGLKTYKDMALVDSDEYLFSQFPVRRVITLDGKPLENPRLDVESGILHHRVRQWSEIDYEAGYDLPWSTGYEASLYPLPHDIENACIQLCKHVYSDDENPSATELAGLKSVDMGDMKVVVNGSGEHYVPQAVVDALSRHRKVNI